MIKSNELIIGNETEQGIVNGIKFTNAWYVFVNDKWIALEHITPIKLTEDWLLKFGFRNLRQEWIKEINDTAFIIEQSTYDNLYYFTGGAGVRYGIGIQYVHKLQNLIFALTNE